MALRLIPELQIMLGGLLRRTKFGFGMPLKQFNRCRPEEVEWLRQKFETNKQLSSRLEYLTRLEQQGRINSFYKTKPIEQFEDVEFYYLLNSSLQYGFNSTSKSELIAKLDSTFFKCLLYKELRTLKELQQYLILLSFNEQVASMEAFEVACCLQVISRFSEVVKKEIDRNALNKAIQRYKQVPEQSHSMLVIGGYASELLENWSQFVTPELLAFWLRHNPRWDFRSIYFVFKLSERLKRPVEPSTRSHMDAAMSKAFVDLQMIAFESNYLVFLLQYYPQYVNRLNLLHFWPQAYVSYLQFYQKNGSFKLQPHRIPPSVLEQATSYTFKKILDLRITLKLDTILSFAKASEDFFTQNLNLIKAIFSIIMDQKIFDLEIEFLLQKALQNKFKFAEFQPQLFEHFNAYSVIELVAYLVKYRWGTIDFWKRTTRWFDKFIEYNKEKSLVESNLKSAAKFITIVSIKNVKASTSQAVLEFTKEVLENPDIQNSLVGLNMISMALQLGRIGEEELWILIQQRCRPLLLKLKKNKQKYPLQRKKFTAVNMAISFGHMRKGSFIFWSNLNSILEESQKTFVLSKVLDPQSPARLYLKSNFQSS